MEITRGKIISAQKAVVFGPEGIGKSTFASQFPDPIFIDTEGSTKHMDVARLPRPSSWTMLLEQVRYVRMNPAVCKTIVIDTADWAEALCIEHICTTKLPPKGKDIINGIEDFGYGKGFTYLAEEFGRLLNLLEEVVGVGVNVVLTAHAQMRKFEQPDELGSYDRWEMKLEKKTAPMVKEWADMVLFANYKTYVVNVDNQGAQKGKNKAQGGKRVMYTSHHPCWDAKNRHDLDDMLDFDFKSIAHCIPAGFNAIAEAKKAAKKEEPKNEPEPSIQTEPAKEPEAVVPNIPEPEPGPAPEVKELDELVGESRIPKALSDLLSENHVSFQEVQRVVAKKGYYPKGTEIANYDPGFVSGVLIGAWPQVYAMILKDREIEDEVPFNDERISNND